MKWAIVQSSLTHLFRTTILRSLVVGTMLLSTFLAALGNGFAQDPADYFRNRCISCHTIGGGAITGPDLKNVEQTAQAYGKDRQWLIRFIQDPKGMIDSGDRYAQQLQREAPGNAVMPSQPDMTPQLAGVLLDLIEAESKLERSQFAGAPSLGPLTAEDAQSGLQIFQGNLPLAGGAPPCISCHTVAGVDARGGGRLGPDLTLVSERLGGPSGLANWLTSPPAAAAPTMQSVFGKRPLKQQEIHSLTALFAQSSQQQVPVGMSGPLMFSLLGLGGTLAGLTLFDTLWKRRFRAVRYPLVHGHPRGEG